MKLAFFYSGFVLLRGIWSFGLKLSSFASIGIQFIKFDEQSRVMLEV